MGTFSWRDSGGAQRTMALTFTLLVGTDDDEGWPVELCLDDVGRVLDTYLAGGGGCCSMQGGYCIDVDGVRLVDTSGIDEFRMTMTWYPALAHLCRGATRRMVWAWEESAMTLTRDGSWLEIEDKHLPRQRVPFTAFTLEALREAELFAEFVRRVAAEVTRRRPGGPGPLLDHVMSHLPRDLDEQLAQLRSAIGAAFALALDGPVAQDANMPHTRAV